MVILTVWSPLTLGDESPGIFFKYSGSHDSIQPNEFRFLRAGLRSLNFLLVLQEIIMLIKV